MSDDIPSVVDKSLLDSVDKYVKSYPDGKDATYVIDRFIRETQRHIKLVKFCASKFQDVLDPAIYIKLLANVKEHDADKLTNTNIIATYAPYNLATFVKNSGLELKPEEECHIEADRETARHEHYLVAKHHPEFWIEELKDTRVVPEDIQPLDTVNMPDEYIAEMIADWMAVGIVMKNTAKEWYNKQRDVKWKFTEDQHKLITKLLEVETEELVTEAEETILPNNYDINTSTESLGSYASLESLFGGGTVVKQLDPMHYSISNFPIRAFLMRIKRKYNTTRLAHLVQTIGISVFNRSKRTIKIHKFFIPELLYLLKSFHYPKELISTIEEHTWVGETSGFDTPVIDYNRVLRNMTAKMYPHQEAFIKEYPELKTRSHLRGYLLSFEQGLGKTITALALMEALGKEKIIIICPKNTVYETWEAHIKKFFKTEQSVYAPYRNQDVNGDYRFYIFNYNAMDKLEDMLIHMDGSNVGVIVDESHNFLRTSSDRTKMLIAISQQLDNADILLLSGTPLKCAGVELIPLLTVLDPYFDKEAMETFKLSFGLNTNLATDVLNARLMKMMHRVTKDVMDLPDKVETTIIIKMKTGKEYTLSAIQKGLSDFITERRAYHFARMDEYEHDFMEVMRYLESIPGFYNRKYEWYFKEVTRLHKSGYDPFRDKDIIVEINTYEREVIEPALPSMMLKKFRYCKAAYKYLDLKIRGEALGQFLTRLRIKMTTEMMQAVNLGELVNDAVKKTVIFTSFTDTIEVCYDYLKKNGYDPLAVYGKTANELTDIVKTFQTNPKKNPLVASLKMISTGATLTAASQVIFLNKPWRSIEYAQASDRVHRIGQDTPVDIISLLLDTGDEPNLSTRMEDIINWSNKQYGEIVGVDNIMGIESLLPYDCTEQEDEEVVVSTEALSDQIDVRRKKVTDYIIKVVNQLDPSGKNGKKYEEFFGKMTDKAFDEFMHLVKDGKYQLHITMPNMDSNLRMEHILKAADTVGVEFFHRLWLDDPVTGKRYLTPKAYPVFKVPVRRQQQFLDEKMSVPDGDTTIDGLSGQVTGPDKASAISNPEIRILHTRGLEKTLIEDVKVRGGDIHSYGEFRRQMEETGVGEISKLDPGSRARSAVIVDILLQGKHLDNNF